MLVMIKKMWCKYNIKSKFHMLWAFKRDISQSVGKRADSREKLRS